MLCAGGLLDQPAGLWFAANQAAYFADFIERAIKEDFQPKDEAELEMRRQITQIRTQVAEEAAMRGEYDYYA